MADAEKLKESRLKAARKWDAAHKDRTNYLRSRSSAKSFIRNHATLDDLKDLRELITAREQELK